jgi:hypothetical protein
MLNCSQSFGFASPLAVFLGRLRREKKTWPQVFPQIVKDQNVKDKFE